MMAGCTTDALIDCLWAYWERKLSSGEESENEMRRGVGGEEPSDTE